MELDRYNQLKSNVDRLQREKDRAEGALSKLKERLQREYGIKSIKGAKSAVTRLKAEVKQAEGDFSSKLDEFEREWGEKLSG